jgi:hypothetical protein
MTNAACAVVPAGRSRLLPKVDNAIGRLWHRHRVPLRGQLAIAGRLTVGTSLKGAIVSRVTGGPFIVLLEKAASTSHRASPMG